MTSQPDPRDQPPTGSTSSLPIDERTASRLLNLGLKGERRPIDDLIDRLARADGEDWFYAALRDPRFATSGDLHVLLERDTAPLDAVIVIKERCKQLSGEFGETRLVSMLLYFLAIAAALAHHQRRISGRPRAKLDPALLELAEVVPADWADLLCAATRVPRD